ncbi:MAG: hypothetical protein BWX71_02579 [Deltaproteobacteria bacterium ADurb.Bin072]|nr:MAG: hypothetical protein BWX71_02579 [Deltaproteobacteria bacterium ADurb.Bin072]
MRPSLRCCTTRDASCSFRSVNRYWYFGAVAHMRPTTTTATAMALTARRPNRWVMLMAMNFAGSWERVFIMANSTS